MSQTGSGDSVKMRGSKTRVCTPPMYLLLGLGLPWIWKCQMKAWLPQSEFSTDTVGTCWCAVPHAPLRSYHPPPFNVALQE